MKFQLFKLIFKKAKEPEIKLTTFVGLLKKPGKEQAAGMWEP